MTTLELENRIRTSDDPEILRGGDFDGMALTDYLHRLLEDRQLDVRAVIQRCNLDRSYGYQLFNGTRRPTRDTLLTLAIHLALTEEETQRLLKLAGRPVLYARNRRDAALLYCISHRLTPAQCEGLLAELEMDLNGTCR